MRTLLRLSLVVLAVPAASSVPSGVSAPADGLSSAVYLRSVDRALERIRADLERSADLYVDHSSWADPWEVRQGRWVVRTTESWLYGKQSAEMLETMIGHFEALLGRPFPADGVNRVDVFPDLESYNVFANEHGAHHSSMYGSFFASGHPARPIALYAIANPTQVGIWMTHSAFHLYSDRVRRRELPTWVEEGLASYFIYWHWAYAWGVDKLATIQSENRFVPLPQLLRAGIESYGADPEARFVELGMLFVYLIHYRPDTRCEIGPDVPPESFAAYLRLLLTGNRAIGHPIHALIQGDAAALEADLRAFEFPR